MSAQPMAGLLHNGHTNRVPQLRQAAKIARVIMDHMAIASMPRPVLINADESPRAATTQPRSMT